MYNNIPIHLLLPVAPIILKCLVRESNKPAHTRYGINTYIMINGECTTILCASPQASGKRRECKLFILHVVSSEVALAVK